MKHHLEHLMTAIAATILLTVLFGLNIITGLVVLNESITQNISISMAYKSGTQWDTDDNGITSITEAIDLTIEDSQFRWEANESKLCTRWTINKNEICYGAEECCNFVDLIPEEGLEWNSPLDLTYGRYGAGLNNTIDAQIIFVNYSLDPENPYSDIRYSEISQLEAVFLNETINETTNETGNETGYGIEEYGITASLSSCGALLIAGETYTLTADVESNTTCFIIMNNSITLDCQGHTITYGISGQHNKPGITAEDLNNITIKNCIIKDVNASGGNGFGMKLTNITNSLIKDNTIRTNGTSANIGVRLYTGSENISIENNTIYARGTSSSNIPVYMETYTNRITIKRNYLDAKGSSNSFGINLYGAYSEISYNNITTEGTSNQNHGIFIGSISGTPECRLNEINNNNIHTYGPNSHGIVFAGAKNNTAGSNYIKTNSSDSYGISLQNTAGGHPETTGNNLTSNIINETQSWIQSISSNNKNRFVNTTFLTAAGSLIIPNNFTVAGIQYVTSAKLNITNNTAYMNTTALPYINTTGTIKLKVSGTEISTIKPRVDYDDDGTFEDCPSALCKEISIGGGIYTFNVTHFTTYSSSSIGFGATITESTTFTEDLSGTGTALIIEGDNITIDCQGHTISGSNTGYGVYSVNNSNITISNCNFENFTQGVYIDPAYGITIENNIFTDMAYGLRINDTNSSTVRNNTFINNTRGIWMYDSYHNKIYNNTFTNNTYGVWIDNGTNNTFYENNFTTSTAHARSDEAGNYFNSTKGNHWDDITSFEIYDTDSDGLGDTGNDYPYNSSIGNVIGYVTDYRPYTTKQATQVDACANLNTPGATYLVNSSVTYAGTGACIIISSDDINLLCSGHKIAGANQGVGIAVQGNNDKIRECTIKGFETGINLSATPAMYISIEKANITNTTYGVKSLNSENEYLNINESEIKNNIYGIYYLGKITSSKIINNTITGNTKDGLYIKHTIVGRHSEYNQIDNNRILNNLNDGIYIIGVDLEPTDWFFRNSNFTLNVITGNTNQSIVLNSFVENNTLWNNTIESSSKTISILSQTWNRSIGNRWQNYDDREEGCIDSNSDNICDTELTIDANDIDYRPIVSTQTAAAAASPPSTSTGSSGYPSWPGEQGQETQEGEETTEETQETETQQEEAAQETEETAEAETEQPASIKQILNNLGIIPEDVEIEEIPCIISEGIVRIKQLKETIEAPKGYETIIDPFSLECKGEYVELNLNIPERYDEVKANICKDGECTAIPLEETGQLECGITIVETLREHDEYTPKGELTSRYKAYSDTKTYEITTPKTVDEPANQNLEITGLPITIQAEEEEIKIEMPYVVSPKIDKNSIRIYYYQNGWMPLESTIDEKSKTIKAKIRGIEGEIILATIGEICDQCEISTFEQVYVPEKGSRAAVIMVHGLGSSPATFQQIINDIAATRQPWQAWTYAYPKNSSIEEAAEELAENIEANLDKYDVIYFAAHSLGGVITETALNYGYDNNMEFVKRTKKVILVGSPHNPLATKSVLDHLLEYMINLRTSTKLFSPTSPQAESLLEGNVLKRIPGIEYYVIAGTEPYLFTVGGAEISSGTLLGINTENDGLVSTESAQNIGGIPINDRCQNYWDIPATHTELLHQDDARIIVEKIIAEELHKELREEALAGNNKYYKLKIQTCSEDIKYSVIGKESKEERETAGCSCGDNTCGLNEDMISCPSDCLWMFKRPGYVPILGIAILGIVAVMIYLGLTKAYTTKGVVIGAGAMAIMGALIGADLIISKANVVGIIVDTAALAGMVYMVFRYAKYKGYTPNIPRISMPAKIYTSKFDATEISQLKREIRRAIEKGDTNKALKTVQRMQIQLKLNQAKLLARTKAREAAKKLEEARKILRRSILDKKEMNMINTDMRIIKTDIEINKKIK